MVFPFFFIIKAPNASNFALLEITEEAMKRKLIPTGGRLCFGGKDGLNYYRNYLLYFHFKSNFIEGAQLSSSFIRIHQRTSVTRARSWIRPDSFIILIALVTLHFVNLSGTKRLTTSTWKKLRKGYSYGPKSLKFHVDEENPGSANAHFKFHLNLNVGAHRKQINPTFLRPNNPVAHCLNNLMMDLRWFYGAKLLKWNKIFSVRDRPYKLQPRQFLNICAIIIQVSWGNNDFFLNYTHLHNHSGGLHSRGLLTFLAAAAKLWRS